MKNLYLNSIPLTLPETASYSDAVTASALPLPLPPIAIQVRGHVLSLSDTALPGERAKILDLRNEEARRVYERSLRFVFLLATAQLYPHKRVRFENSMGGGVYCTLDEVRLSTLAVRRIELRMRELVARDLPFTRELIPRLEALEYFRSTGWDDKAELLKYRAPGVDPATDMLTLYSCDGLREYFYGAMLPSTGHVNIFDLRFMLPGILLLLPDKDDLNRPAPFIERPKLSRVLAETAYWADMLECRNVADLNRMSIDKELREFVRVNEALQAKRISDVADRFVESGAQIMLIAGPSSSGKTTFTNRMAIELRVHALKPICISLDNYYIDRDKVAREPNGELDLEKLDALDVPYFNEQLVAMLQHQPVELPEFDFSTGRRRMSGRVTAIAPGQPIIIEGIHGLNEDLTREIPRGSKFKIYISALTQLNLDDHNRIRTTDLRLLRRIVRDAQFRGASVEHTLSMWPSVVRGEEKYIFKFQEQADVMFDSSLMYEMCLLKEYAYPLLKSVMPDNEYYTKSQRLLSFLDYFVTAYIEDEVPLNSILREFIGGSCFYRRAD